jgi:hypothetical protein
MSALTHHYQLLKGCKDSRGLSIGDLKPGESIALNGITYPGDFKITWDHHLNNEGLQERPTTCTMELKKDTGHVAGAGLTSISEAVTNIGAAVGSAFGGGNPPPPTPEPSFMGDWSTSGHNHNTFTVWCDNITYNAETTTGTTVPNYPVWATGTGGKIGFHTSASGSPDRIVGTVELPEPEQNGWNSSGWVTVRLGDGASSGGSLWNRENMQFAQGPVRQVTYEDMTTEPSGYIIRDWYGTGWAGGNHEVNDNYLKNHQERMKEVEEAKKRSLKLLKDWLSTAEYNYLMEGELHLPSQNGEEIYILKRDAHARIEVRNKKTQKPKHYLCVNPIGFAEGDMLLSKILAIKTNEREFLKVAIPHEMP